MAVIKDAESLAQLEQLLKKEIQAAELSGQEIYQFDPKNGDAYDVMRIKNTRIVSMWGGESLKDCVLNRPGLQFCTSSDLMKIRSEIHKLDLYEISQEAFNSALNCLPPLDHAYDRDRNESFKSPERYIDNLTTMYVSVDDRYFALRDEIKTPHDVLVDRAKKFAEKNPVAETCSPKA